MRGHFGRRSIDGRSRQPSSASLPALQTRNSSIRAHPGVHAWCLCQCQGSCSMVWAGCRQAAAPTEHPQPGASLCSGTAAVGFSPGLFSFPTCRMGLRRAVPRAQLPEPAALVLLCSQSRSPWRCLCWLCSGLWGRSRQPSWPHNYSGLAVGPCWSWDVPPIPQNKELTGNSFCPQINMQLAVPATN